MTNPPCRTRVDAYDRGHRSTGQRTTDRWTTRLTSRSSTNFTSLPESRTDRATGPWEWPVVYSSAWSGDGPGGAGTGCSSRRPMRSSEPASAAVVSRRGSRATGGSGIVILLARPVRLPEQALPLRPPSRFSGARRPPGDGPAHGIPLRSSRLRHESSYASTPHWPAAVRPADPPAPTVLATASRSTCPRSRTAAHHPTSPKSASR